EEMEGVRALEHAIKEMGFIGAHLYPHWFRMEPDHRKYYPFYAKCVELDIPVLLHTSTNLTRTKLAEYGRPIYLDGVAKDFPELRIVAVHGGWPWILEMIAVALKQPNIYIEISGTHPRYIGMPGTGWEPLLVYGNSLLKHKILWGSNWPMIGPKESLEEFRKFPLKEEVKDLWFGGNALRALKLDK
ncbi:MAG: amidohydrolase family protein, partial [Nitrospinota bacterium]